MNNERDDALSSANCPNCHAPGAMPTAPFPPQFDGGATDHPEFNACKECGMLYADMAIALKNVARDEPTGEHARKSTYRAAGWTLIAIGVAAAAICAFLSLPVGILAGAIVMIAGIAAVVLGNKQERGSRRASGLANDQ
jgi:hypothetical protein